jgi:hypothetical protein
MSIAIAELPENTLEALKNCFTDLAISSIEKLMGNKSKENKGHWTTSAEFPFSWEEKLRKIKDNNIVELFNDGEIAIRNIFDSKDTSDRDYFKVKIEKELFLKLLTGKKRRKNHLIPFYQYVKLELAKLVKEQKNVALYLDQITFQNYINDLIASKEKENY